MILEWTYCMSNGMPSCDKLHNPSQLTLLLNVRLGFISPIFISTFAKSRIDCFSKFLDGFIKSFLEKCSHQKFKIYKGKLFLWDQIEGHWVGVVVTQIHQSFRPFWGNHPATLSLAPDHLEYNHLDPMLLEKN